MKIAFTTTNFNHKISTAKQSQYLTFGGDMDDMNSDFLSLNDERNNRWWNIFPKEREIIEQSGSDPNKIKGQFYRDEKTFWERVGEILKNIGKKK